MTDSRKRKEQALEQLIVDCQHLNGTPLNAWIDFVSKHPKQINVKSMVFKRPKQIGFLRDPDTFKEYLATQNPQMVQVHHLHSDTLDTNNVVLFDVLDTSVYAEEDLPMNFRGGFFDITNGAVVLAPLMKMFNIGESGVHVPGMEDLDTVLNNIEEEMVLTCKENGAFAGVSGYFAKPTANRYTAMNLKDLFVSSKTSILNRMDLLGKVSFTFPEYIRYYLIESLVSLIQKVALEDLDDVCNRFFHSLNDGVPKSLLFELMDDINDPHVIRSPYDRPTLVLVAIRENIPPFNFLPMDEVKRFGDQFNIKVAFFKKIHSKRDLMLHLETLERYGTFEGHYREGIIISARPKKSVTKCPNIFMFKAKVMKLADDYEFLNLKYHYGVRRCARESIKSLISGRFPYEYRLCPLINALIPDFVRYYFENSSQIVSNKTDLDLIDHLFQTMEKRALSYSGNQVIQSVKDYFEYKTRAISRKTLIIMIGIQGSGKSTVAKILSKLFSHVNPALQQKFVISDQVPPTSASDPHPFEARVTLALYENDIVFADKMNLNKEGREYLFKAINVMNDYVDCYVIDLVPNVKTCSENVKNRGVYNSTLTTNVPNFVEIITNTSKAYKSFMKLEYPLVKFFTKYRCDDNDTLQDLSFKMLSKLSKEAALLEFDARSVVNAFTWKSIADCLSQDLSKIIEIVSQDKEVYVKPPPLRCFQFFGLEIKSTLLEHELVSGILSRYNPIKNLHVTLCHFQEDSHAEYKFFRALSFALKEPLEIQLNAKGLLIDDNCVGMIVQIPNSVIRARVHPERVSSLLEASKGVVNIKFEGDICVLDLSFISRKSLHITLGCKENAKAVYCKYMIDSYSQNVEYSIPHEKEYILQYFRPLGSYYPYGMYNLKYTPIELCVTGLFQGFQLLRVF